MSTKPATNRQLPENSILDHFGKQAYLGNQFIYSTLSASSAATTETPFLLLTNPLVSASSFPSGYTSLFVSLRQISCLTTSQSAIIKTYIGPTVSATGTSKTPLNVRPADPTTSIAALSTGPTVSPDGSLVGALAVGAFTTISDPTLIILDPGKSLLITLQVSATATAAQVDLGWYEL